MATEPPGEGSGAEDGGENDAVVAGTGADCLEREII